MYLERSKVNVSNCLLEVYREKKSNTQQCKIHNVQHLTKKGRQRSRKMWPATWKKEKIWLKENQNGRHWYYQTRRLEKLKDEKGKPNHNEENNGRYTQEADENLEIKCSILNNNISADYKLQEKKSLNLKHSIRTLENEVQRLLVSSFSRKKLRSCHSMLTSENLNKVRKQKCFLELSEKRSPRIDHWSPSWRDR